jgi:hypothetical protein
MELAARAIQKCDSASSDVLIADQRVMATPFNVMAGFIPAIHGLLVEKP